MASNLDIADFDERREAALPHKPLTNFAPNSVVKFASLTAKFARVFTRTAYYIRLANVIEKRHGHLVQSKLQQLIISWAKEVLNIIEIDVEIRGNAPELRKPVLFVGNHVSYVDIPLLMASVPVVFVSKAEVSKWLVIGPASQKAGTVFVKRESGKSRAETAQAIADCLINRNQSIALFPSGTTTLDESKPWRKGAFAIAAKHGIAVQPFRITYQPLRKLAYIEKDFFPTHLWKLLSSRTRIKATLEFGEVCTVTEASADCLKIQAWCQDAHKTTNQGLF